MIPNKRTRRYLATAISNPADGGQNDLVELLTGESRLIPANSGLLSRPKVVIGHPRIGRGGSEARVMWLIEALKRDCDVTVVTTAGWDLAALNAFYGTKVLADEVKVRTAPVPFVVRNFSAAALRGSCYQRFARQIAAEYDVRISAYNVTDWGLPAVHFIADFKWHRKLTEELDPPTPGFIYRDSILRKAYLRIATAYAKPSGRDLFRDDLLIANSRWTADLMRRVCRADCAAIVYPSVWTEFPEVAWEDKEQAFVMIGRIAPEKQVEQAIAIVDAVRQRGHLVRLHICGHIGNDLYGQRINQLCNQHANWLVAEGEVSGNKKANLLAGCRFGIQTRGAEPFGISVAEMVKAGAIVFAPNDGGQTEILDHDELLFAGVDDAAEKIIAVLTSSEKQRALRTHLARQAGLFTAEKFMETACAQVRRGSPGNRQFIERFSRRRKVVIGHPMIGRGGSESNVMWLIEALKCDYDVTVITTQGWDLAALNAFYGTEILENEVKVRIAPVPFVVRNQSVAALRGACYQRFARRVAAEYDVRISAYNPTDWGLPAIHFIADFSGNPEIRNRFDPPTPGFIYQDSILRKAYLGIAAAYGRPSGRDVLREDRLIANSQWTADVMSQAWGVARAAVVYHSVWTEFPSVPWDDKEKAFVMIGRIAPEKQVERAIAILEAIRKRGHAIRLHLCGHIGGDLYGQRIARLCRQHADWIVVHGRVSGEKKARLLAGCRFGIQTRGAEPFGISVAEMVKAGAIVFCPADGGQAEILQHPDLLFTELNEAVEKIQIVLESPSLQSTLRDFLSGRANLFSAQNFMRDAQAAIEHSLTANPNKQLRTASRTS